MYNNCIIHMYYNNCIIHICICIIFNIYSHDYVYFQKEQAAV